MTVTPLGELWKLDFIILHNGDRRQAYLTEAIRDVEHASQCWQRTLDEPESPFSKLPVARLEVPGGCLTLVGRKLFVLDYEHGLQVEPAGPETLSRFGIAPGGFEPLWERPPADG